MELQRNNAIGRGASTAVAIETVAFAISLILGLVVRSQLGPVLGYIASLLLAISVIVMMACLYLRTPAGGMEYAWLAGAGRSYFVRIVLLR